ncbi:hypothetical protein [Geoalkalibacter sp.]|uniref:hypothetical protein n=1 Tax=Geoalkalibacter sp. TaxID=3041440 RepID=UPI00272EA383|nr:hypothetical protein [Geoalkalibacter sp.]
MKKIFGLVVWGLLFVLLLAAVDQALLRTDLDVPGYREARRFYVDFRNRLLRLSGAEPSLSIEGIIDRAPAAPKGKQADAGGYLYADETGALHLVDTLDEVPPRYRGEAKPLSR